MEELISKFDASQF